MNGMEVSVTYSDASVLSAIWGTTGAGAGAASVANGFSLSESGDTFPASGFPFSGIWTLQNLRPALGITGFSINARLGDTLFDTTLPLSGFGTDGSFQGLDFEFVTVSQVVFNATATYSDALKLNSATTPMLLRVTCSRSFSLNKVASARLRSEMSCKKALKR